MSRLIDQQVRSNDCGVSASKIICNLLDTNISRSIIEDNIQLDEEGASLGSIYQFFVNHNFKANYKLLDINTLKNSRDEVAEWLPCISPIKTKKGWHYVVIDQIKKDSFRILDPAESHPYYLSFQEFKKLAYYTSSNLDYVDMEQVLQLKVREELDKHNIQLPHPPTHQELTDLFNKLSYYSHLVENYGFKDQESARRFLVDLIFNQELQHIPKHFAGIQLKREKLALKTPVLLSVKKTEQTTAVEGEDNRSGYWKLYKSIGKIREIWYIFLVTALLSSIIAYVGLFINQILIDHILPSYQLNTLQLFAVGVGLFYIIDTIFYIYKKYVSIHLSNALDRFFLSQFDEKLSVYSIRYLQSYKRGDLTERLSDTMRLKSFFVRYFSSILVNVITAIFSLFLLIMINWKLSMIVLFVLLLFGLLFYIFTPIIENLERQRYIKKAGFMSKFIEKIDGIQVIKALGLEDYSSGQIKNGIEELIQIQTKSRYVGMANSVLTSLIIAFSSLVLLVLTSKLMIVHNAISLGMIITFLALSSKIFGAFSSLLNRNLSLQEHKVILNRFFDFDEYKNKQEAAPEKAKDSSSTHPMSSKIQRINFRKLTMQQVAFTYDNDKLLLKDIDLDIKRGEKVLILGENGTGKSTLCKIMGLLYAPTSGQLLLNDIDLSMYPKEQLRKKVVFVSGEDLLFNESILFNISFGRKVDMEQLIEYAKVINFYEFINKKAEKFDFIIHENGRNLSTGQRKKVLLLRALMTNADLIILDEIFNGIDVYSKERAETMISIMDDKAFVIVSHIPLTNIDFNQTFKLRNGLLLQQDT